MIKDLSERRLVENEFHFKRPNEKLAKGLEELRKMAVEDKQSDWYPDDPIKFFCECSDINCRERIRLKPEKYLKLHQNSNQFVLLPGHAIPKIERTIKNENNYIVVEKYISPPMSLKKGK